MSRVFISYRRADSAKWANKVNRHIGMRFGKDLVFEDVDDIKPGDDFLAVIRRELAACQVFIILIGPRWFDAARRRRLNRPQDVLRQEVATALKSKGTVLPVLVGGGEMPSREDLPRPLKALSTRDAFILRSGRWSRDIQTLIERVRQIILPTAEEVPLGQAQQEVYEMQTRYFGLLAGGNTADALELAQETSRYLDRVLPLHPQDPMLKVTRGYLYKNEAQALLGLGRNTEAAAALEQGETVFRTMLVEIPRDPSAWNGLGSIEAVRGNDRQALAFINKALKIEPRYPAALRDKEQVLARLKAKRAGK